MSIEDTPGGRPADTRPNIVLILADDLGFSDIGAYGSEIRTPNLDGLADGGIRFTQMYNSARCCPSRAALLTGLNPQQAGVGHMMTDLGTPGYQGYLGDNCVTIAEALRGAGYRTLMSGKWHVGGEYDLHHPEAWRPGERGWPTPTQRGFDEFYGTLKGAHTYYNPPTLMQGETFVQPDSPDYYYTDAVSENACRMIDGAAGGDAPFFLYVAFTSPHWPLHALEEDIARYEGKYRGGWDRLRTARHEELRARGLVDRRWEISPRDPDSPAWENTEHRDWEDLRMAVYAAQIDRMDQGIGRIMSRLRAHGVEDNTLVIFLADNGGCAEFCAEDSDKPEPAQFNTPTLDGRPVRMGNNPEIRPGAADTFQSYDLPWANASNTPFRLFKRWVHEGGISTPLVIHWPERIRASAIVHEPAHVIDIMPTCLAAAGAEYPKEHNGHAVTPVEGESLLPVLEGREWSRERPIFWEHEGNRAVRMGQWKLVSEYPGPWELYDIDADRTELDDRAGREPRRVAAMARAYEEWAERAGVRVWAELFDTIGRNTRGRRDHVVGG